MRKLIDSNFYRKIDKEPVRKCSHELCSECQGTGRKRNGTQCIHMISCKCRRCNPTTLESKKEMP